MFEFGNSNFRFRVIEFRHRNSRLRVFEFGDSTGSGCLSLGIVISGSGYLSLGIMFLRLTSVGIWWCWGGIGLGCRGVGV